MNKERYLIPQELIPGAATLQNGEPMKQTMIGAYFGSSAEVEVSYSITSSHAGNVIAKPYSDLVDKFANVPRKGEFAALKGESQILPETRFGERIIEITTPEQAVKMKDDIRRFMSPDNGLASKLSYMGSDGKQYPYRNVMLQYNAHVLDNKSVQAEKAALIKERGYEAQFIDGKKVSPEYPEDLLESLAELSKKQWSVTGYNLRLHFKIKHTIAKDSAFFAGSLTQAQLDELAQKFDYKEHSSFWSGKLGKADIAIPVQSMSQIREILDYVQDNHPIVKEWGESNRQIVTLTRGIYKEA